VLFRSEPADATILKQADIVDNLTSTSTTAPLSANQGKELQDTKAGLTGGADANFASSPQIAGQNIQDEGNWTPRLLIGGVDTGITYSSRFGRWYKSAGRIYYYADVRLSNKGSETGNVEITDLPDEVLTINSQLLQEGGWLRVINVTKTMAVPTLQASTSTRLLLRAWIADGGFLSIDNTNLNNNSILIFSGSYAYDPT
jgi:hypothetical protein